MKRYKDFVRNLQICGWEICDEAHNGNFYPHYFKYYHPADPMGLTLEMVCSSCQDGSPHMIMRMWQCGVEVPV